MDMMYIGFPVANVMKQIRPREIRVSSKSNASHGCWSWKQTVYSVLV